jgi:TolB-like protein/DNA-binding winged helix-turn-helix (wHTH) protein/Tfp pilus assembly protein PilF
MQTVFTFGGFRFDEDDLVLQKDEVEIPITRKAAETLLALLLNAGHVVGKEELLDRVWADTFVNEATLAQNILTLRKALCKQPNGEDYIGTVPKRGYRFEAAVTKTGRANRAILPASPTFEPTNSSGPVTVVKRATLLAWLAASVAIIILTGYLVRSRGGSNASGGDALKISSIAVLSLKNMSGDASQDYLAEGITEAITTDLAEFRSLRVVSRTSAMQYSGRTKSLREIARELHVDAIVEGGMIRSGEHVRVTARLIRAANDQQIWAGSYDRELRDVLALQNDIAGDIAEHVRAQITAEDRQRLATVRVLNPAAHEEYLKGRFFWNKRTESGYTDAIAHFDRATKMDPNYPEPWAGMADAYALLGSLGGGAIPRREAMNKARTVARKALELDASSAEAHTSLAFVLMHYDWDFAAAEQEFLRAIELNPSYATAHQWHAINLAATGKIDAGLAELQRAQELDPLSLIISVDIGEFLGLARRYDEAVAQLQNTLKMDPHFLLAHVNLADVYNYEGKYTEAEKHALEALDVDPNSMWAKGVLATCYALEGQKQKARTMMESMQRSTRVGEIGHHFASVSVALGDKDAAFHWLQVAYDHREGSLILLRVIPYYDPVRSDPRFIKLLRRIEAKPAGVEREGGSRIS